MNNREKRLVKHVEALGWRRDHNAITPALAYRHPNDETQLLKIFIGQTDDSRATAVRKMAEKVAGLASSGPDAPKLKEQARIKRKSAKAQREAEIKAANERAAKSEAEYQARQRAEAAEKRRRELERIMRPGYGR